MVVFIITTAILFVLGIFALLRALFGRRRRCAYWRLRGDAWILAFAFFAVRILPLVPVGSTAVTSVPLAPAVVVFVIAIAITHILSTAAFT